MRRTVPVSHRQFACAMRNEPTSGEAALWQMLRGRKLEGLRFRRQHPIAGFLVDFFCLDAKLIIEVDGSHHAENVDDIKRDATLQALGYQVLRFWNDDVLHNGDGVVQMILEATGKRGL